MIITTVGTVFTFLISLGPTLTTIFFPVPSGFLFPLDTMDVIVGVPSKKETGFSFVGSESLILIRSVPS